MYYIQVAENEGEEPVELPLEADYTLAMSTLTAQYQGASGLKYRYVFDEGTYSLSSECAT